MPEEKYLTVDEMRETFPLFMQVVENSGRFHDMMTISDMLEFAANLAVSLTTQIESTNRQMTELKNTIYQQFLDWRNIDTPCKVCGGTGVRVYGSTATWHGGAGGQMLTRDICDHCWGSGDEARKGVNLRAIVHHVTK